MTTAGSRDDDTPITREMPVIMSHVAIYAIPIVQPDGTCKAEYRLGHNYPDIVQINIFDIETIVLAVAANILRDHAEPELAQLVSAAALDTYESSKHLDEILKPVGGDAA